MLIHGFGVLVSRMYKGSVVLLSFSLFNVIEFIFLVGGHTIYCINLIGHVYLFDAIDFQSVLTVGFPFNF